MLAILLLFLFFIVAYPYLVYPLILVILQYCRARPVRKLQWEADRPHSNEVDWPLVSVLVPAYNEASVIEEKIRNLLSINYPILRYEVVVANDGSTDATASIARQFEDGCRVRVFDYPENRGKTSVLNSSVPRLRGEIVVFSDASVLLSPNALRDLAANFSDPQVGVACGKYRIVMPEESNTGQQEDYYWRYETALKQWESNIWSTIGAHGALYAMRLALYKPIPPGTINDDFILPMRVLQQGFRVVYDPTALGYDRASEMAGFPRRVRIMIGNFQQIREFRGFLRPFRFLPLFFFFSRKIMRLVAPIAMIGALVANVMLWGEPIFNLTLVAQLLFYVLALAGSIFQLRPKVLLAPYYFVMLNVATIAALWSLSLGRARVWK